MKLKILRIVAVCDLDKKKAISFSKKFKIAHYYTDINKLLDLEKSRFC